jgi:thiopurine S-methyltransferase
MLNKAYWEKRYAGQNLGWDIGSVSPPLKAYIDQLKNKELKILVPGAGYGYEAIYLFENGFKNAFVVDIAAPPLAEIRSKCPDFPKEQLLQIDFFELKLRDFDLVLEQTFFCALLPELRSSYVKKMHELLKEGGRLAGLLFDFPLTENGPPFGGSTSEYQGLFKEDFKILTLAQAYNSIGPRQGNELFFIFEK